MIKIIVFDFDGVIVRNSEFGKEKAWSIILPKESKEKILKYKEKWSGGKGSRFDILRDLALDSGIKQDQVDRWVFRKSEEYNQITSDIILKEGILIKDREALMKLERHFRLYMNSATPESVLQNILTQLEVNHLFDGIYGQPQSKNVNLIRSAKNSRTIADQILFIGDQDSDWQVAKQFGCHFVGIMNNWNNWRKGIKDFPLIGAVKDLPDFLGIIDI